ncbi:MAG: pyruvate dehydrogenase (acetyl-transferring), homodimeric type [Dehalococcoidia bacterium]|nr:MAG: pyruvate dehydrogenase (acetyl-transferring), homodimeric type [Dehalococcoidia bacterium]
MTNDGKRDLPDAPDWVETREWTEALRDVVRTSGAARASRLLESLQIDAQRAGIPLPVTSRTPYVNTIPPEHQPPYPGDLELERRITRLVRWNALAMVTDANERTPGIGGHISTYASAAVLYEVGFNHFWRGPDAPGGADLLYIQGHASPGIYARSYLEGRISAKEMRNFRREFAEGGGLSSYPHPWLMPEYWQFPTVSMGLGPITAIYQARFMRYLEQRGLIPASDRKVWCFLGDGETDEPESLGAISLAAREGLDNLVFVVNCNLQRLDGLVRGNGQIIPELEAVFRGVGWNVIKVLWGGDWDPLLARDTDGLLVQRMGQVVDGEYQKYAVAGGGYVRERFWGVDSRLARLVAHLSDEDLLKLRLGGHDHEKVYAAYYAATQHRGGPTVILARTIKGYGLGTAGEARNVAHQQKHLGEDDLLAFRDRFTLPLSDAEVGNASLFRPAEDSRETRYLLDRRRALGGFLPQRRVREEALPLPAESVFAEFLGGSGEREVSTTMAFVRMLAGLMRAPDLGKRIVPVIPDEARTFGMESFFREFGIYAHQGQNYEPVDRESLIYYKESTDGQVLEEGINEAGAFSSMLAAGTSYANHDRAMLPFFILYSMFGLQRVGDLAWAAGDARARGFLIGGTAGRTTLNGEGLQHQDGHSHLLASVIPNMRAYDPAFAFEIAVLLQDGVRRKVEAHEDGLTYLTVGNENYRQPPMPEGDRIREGIVRGLYRFRSMAPPSASGAPRVHLIGSGAIMNEVLHAQEMLAERFGVASDAWSATSYTELRREALEVERWNVLHPEAEARVPYATACLGDGAPVVAASDYLKALPDGLAKWIPGRLVSLGTDGFGRSETREALRDHFEVDCNHIAFAALSALMREETIPARVAIEARASLGIDPERGDPARA